MTSFSHTIVPLLLAFSLIAGLVGIITGLWLLFAPAGFARLEEKTGSVFSLRRSIRPFDISRNIDRYFYRHHHTVGLLIVAASAFTLYQLMFGFVPGSIARYLFQHLPPVVGDWLGSTISFVLLFGNIFAIIIGLVIFTRPSALKAFEAHANRWLTLRKHTRWFQDSRRAMSGHLLQNQPRTLGTLILVLSVYLVTMLSMS